MEVQPANNAEVQTTQTTATQEAADITTTTQEQDSKSQQSTEQQSNPGDDLGWTDEQKAYIKSLRDENAKYRTRAKERDSEVSTLNERLGKFETGLKTLFGEEETDLTPEQQIEQLSMQNEALEVKSALRDAAFEYGIGRENYDYFEFLVNKRLSELEEGQELTEDDLDEIARSANGRSANSATSVEGGNPPLPEENTGGITLEQFSVMGIGDKSALYQKDRALYEKLSNAEKMAKLKR